MQATGLSQHAPPKVSGNDNNKAVLWQNGVETALFPNASAPTSASGVNDGGEVVGSDADGNPYFWINGVVFNVMLVSYVLFRPGSAVPPEERLRHGESVFAGAQSR